MRKFQKKIRLSLGLAYSPPPEVERGKKYPVSFSTYHIITIKESGKNTLRNHTASLPFLSL